jgi:hypothetical protein
VRDEADSPRELVAEVEGHARALLRDVLCGYLDADLKGVADDILLETTPEPFIEITARDLRREAHAEEEAAVHAEQAAAAQAEAEQDTSELEPVAWEPSLEADAPASVPAQAELEGVTASADWGWGEPEDYSAPV